MKLVCASDSFKGSLDSERIGQLLKEVSARIFPDAQVDTMLVADGGEGTMKTVVKELKGTYEKIDVLGPLFETVSASYGIILRGKTALIEMAEASGLPLVPEKKRNPGKTTTYGTGMMIRDAMEKGIRNIVIAIGGSATNDGGMGVMAALGVRFLDASLQELKPIGNNLNKIAHIDLQYLHPAVTKTSFTVMCDVKNPLLGEFGATYTFGKQKGGTRSQLDFLEQGMVHYAQMVEHLLHVKAAEQPGAGAAGGLGFALMTFLHACLKPGIETVLDLIHFDEKIKDADLVITGEGRMDWQSSLGKVPSGIGKRCMIAQIPAVAIVGGILEGYEDIYEYGIQSVVTTVNGIMDLSEAMEHSEQLYKDAAYRLLRAIKCGMDMKRI